MMSNSPVRVALAQVLVDRRESVGARVDRVLELTEATAQDADLVVLPEAWPTGAFDIAAGLARAEPIDGPFVSRLSAVAATTKTWIHGGSFIEVDDGKYFNTSVLFNASGDLVATYRKLHLFGFDTGEAALLGAGNDVVVVDTPLGPTGLATCYDLRFPELFRIFSARGATAVLVPTGWPRLRIDAWTLFARARAAENQLWFVGCNEVGSQADAELGGNSIVVDPSGRVVAEAGQDPTVMTVELDPAEPDRVREAFPTLRDRRFAWSAHLD